MRFSITLATLFAAYAVYGAPQGAPGDPAAAAAAAVDPAAAAAAAVDPAAAVTAAGADSAAVGAGSAATGAASDTSTTSDSAEDPAGQDAGASNNDIAILNFALTLEHLEAEFYKKGLETFGEPDFRRANIPDPTQAVLNFHHILAHEAKHVTTLETVIQSLGGEPVPPCEYEFPMNTVEEFMTLASVLEKVGVSAYNGAVALIENPDLQTAAATIDTIEARHAAFLNTVNGLDPFPAAFDTALDGRSVITLAAPVIKSCPFELPFAPFGALKLLTTDPIKPGDLIELEFERAGDVQHFCNFLFSNKSEVTELSDSDECEVPQDVRGDIFMMITSSSEGVTLTDTNAIVAGPIVVNIDTAHDDSCEKFIGKDEQQKVDNGFEERKDDERVDRGDGRVEERVDRGDGRVEERVDRGDGRVEERVDRDDGRVEESVDADVWVRGDDRSGDRDDRRGGDDRDGRGDDRKGDEKDQDVRKWKEDEDRKRKEKDDRERNERDARKWKEEEDRKRKESNDRGREEDGRERKERDDRMRMEMDDRMRKEQEGRMRKERDDRMRMERDDRMRREEEDRMRRGMDGKKEDRMPKGEDSMRKEEDRMPKGDRM